MKQYLIIFYAVLFGGAIGFFGKYSLTAFDPVFLIYLRIAISLAIFAIFLALRKRLGPMLKNIFSEWKKMVLLALTGAGIGMVVGFIGLQKTTAINYSLLFNASSITIVLFSAWLLNEKIKFLDWLFVILALIGSCLIVTQGKLSFSLFNGASFLGDVLVFAAAIGWGFYSVYGPYIAKTQKQESLFPLFGSFLIAFIAMTPFIIWRGFVEISSLVVVANLNLTVIGSTLALAIFSTAIVFLFWFYLIGGQGGGVLAAIIALSENFVGVILPALFLGESVTKLTLVGGILIIIPLIIREIIRARAKKYAVN
jgi:drug/metabolite transporter (DMT)-like permease